MLSQLTLNFHKRTAEAGVVTDGEIERQAYTRVHVYNMPHVFHVLQKDDMTPGCSVAGQLVNSQAPQIVIYLCTYLRPSFIAVV